MSRFALLVILLCTAPYAHMFYVWGICTDCDISGDYLFWSLVLLLCLPLVLAIAAFSTMPASVKALRSGIENRDAGTVARGGIGTYLGASVVTTGLVGAFLVFSPFLEEPEPGRDRLGRICETSETGSSVTCRPDPNRDRKSPLEQMNEQRQSERSQEELEELRELGWAD